MTSIISIAAFIILVWLLVLLSAAESCNPSMMLANNYTNSDIERTVLSNDKIVIDTDFKCDQKDLNNPNRFICYNNGKCLHKFEPFNRTHVKKSYYCLCEPGFGGDIGNCLEDNRFLLDQANLLQDRNDIRKNTVILFGIVLISLALVVSVALLLVHLKKKARLSRYRKRAVINTTTRSRHKSHHHHHHQDDDAKKVLTQQTSHLKSELHHDEAGVLMTSSQL